MKAHARKSYYPLDELILRDQSDFPEGRTLAVKRAVFSGKDGMDDGGIARLNIVDASPDDYVIDLHHLASGLTAATVQLFIEDSHVKRVERNNGRSYKVEALRFAGQLAGQRIDGIEAIGACVRGELATGFVHILDGAKGVDLFEAAAEAEIEFPVPERVVTLPEPELALAR